MIDLFSQHMNRVYDSIEERQISRLLSRARVEQINPPIPTPDFDWMAWIDGEEESGLAGYGATRADAMQNLRDVLCSRYGA